MRSKQIDRGLAKDLADIAVDTGNYYHSGHTGARHRVAESELYPGARDSVPFRIILVKADKPTSVRIDNYPYSTHMEIFSRTSFMSTELVPSLIYGNYDLDREQAEIDYLARCKEHKLSPCNWSW